MDSSPNTPLTRSHSRSFQRLGDRFRNFEQYPPLGSLRCVASFSLFLVCQLSDRAAPTHPVGLCENLSSSRRPRRGYRALVFYSSTSAAPRPAERRMSSVMWQDGIVCRGAVFTAFVQRSVVGLCAVAGLWRVCAEAADGGGSVVCMLCVCRVYTLFCGLMSHDTCLVILTTVAPELGSDSLQFLRRSLTADGLPTADC